MSDIAGNKAVLCGSANLTSYKTYEFSWEIIARCPFDFDSTTQQQNRAVISANKDNKCIGQQTHTAVIHKKMLQSF
jgi:hypothetical protein